MRIRIEGSPDLVEAWKKRLEEAYGITGSVYANHRRNQEDIRCYFNLDDRQAAEIVGLMAKGTGVEAAHGIPAKPRASSRTKPLPRG